MNVKAVDKLIPGAYDLLKEKKVDIVNKEGKIPRGFRGQIATFGAAVTTNSLLAAIAFFGKKPQSDSETESQKGTSGCKVPRDKLMKAIFMLLPEEETKVYGEASPENLFRYASKNQKKAKTLILEAAVAIKLALNLFENEEGDVHV